MSTDFGIAPGRRTRRRVASAFAAVGALLLSSGMVMVTAPAANADHNAGHGGNGDDKIGICHAPAQLNNPYTYNTVDGSSTEESEAHFDHARNPEYTWGEAGAWWNGTWYPPNAPRPDLIPGITLPAGTVVTKGFCDAAASIGPKRTSASVSWQEPSCDNGNQAGWTGTATEGVTYQPTSGSAAPSSSVVVTAMLAPGYAFPANFDNTFEHTFGPAEDCRGSVTPVDPTVTQPACTGPGTSSPLSVVLPANANGITYSYDEQTRTVTAQVTDPDKRLAAQLPGDWQRVDDDTATYVVDLVPAGDCLVTVQADPPYATDNSCNNAGSLVLPSVAGDGYHWTGDTADTPGAHTVTAVADAGYVLTGQVTWTVNVESAGQGLDCQEPAVEVTPAAPRWIEATCTTGPSVDYSEVEGVQYVTTGDVAPLGTATVTASALGNRVLAAGAVSSWTHTFAAKPTGAACDDDPTDPTDPGTDKVVTPSYPWATDATCFRDGKLKVPAQPEGVVMTRQGSAPGDVSFTFAPAEGYAFPAGTDTSVTVAVQPKITGEECLLGDGTVKPKPKPEGRAPVVLGDQAAVPTAVAAGIGDTLTHASSTGSPRLAQALVAGGLLMLVLAGATGLGRRTRGAHES
jgi:hypothetical protein